MAASPHVMLALLAWLCVFNVSANAPSVIDVHIHASTETSKRGVFGIDSVLAQSEEALITYSVVSVADMQMARAWRRAAPEKFLISVSFPCTAGMHPRQYPCFDDNDGWPELSWLENEIAAGHIAALGELLHVYYGIAPTDRRLRPYFELAERYDIPVGVHAADGPPENRRATGCCPNFNGQMGNPELLQPLLDELPGLRIYLMHGGEVRFHQHAINLMKKYSRVYADLSILNSVYPEKLYFQMLKAFVDAGLTDQLMFGSDNVPAKIAVSRLTAAPFLTDEQRHRILYDNAARFFKLPPRGETTSPATSRDRPDNTLKNTTETAPSG